MLRISIRQVRADQVDRLRAWLAEVNQRQDEVRETYRQEGVHHEQAYLLEGKDGPVLIYAIEMDDPLQARLAFQNSQLPIDHEHAAVMREVLAGRVAAELLYECRLSEDPATP
jgi:hypothetical protein